MQSSYGEAAWNMKDFRPMHIFYLTPIVNPWFPGICYKYGTKSAVWITCKNLETELMLKDRISIHFFFD